MKSKFYRFCNSMWLIYVPAIIIGILFIAAFALCGSDDRAVAIVMFVALGVFFFVFGPLALLCIWFRRKPEAEKEALMKGTEKAKPVKVTKAVKPVQVSRTKTHGSADSGNYSYETMQASYSVQTDPVKGEQTAVLAAQRYKTKTRTRSRNLSHKHTGKTSSRSITVTAETCRTTTTYQTVTVTAQKQKATATAEAPKRVSASKSARLFPAVDEDGYDGLQSRG